VPDGIDFSDESDVDFDFNDLLTTVLKKAEVGHWKAATRKLKQLQKRYESPERLIPAAAFIAVLEACSLDRLHGARAAEPARKVVEEMAVRGYSINKPELAQLCVTSCIGMGAGGTHDGFGGIDPALAMLAALENMPSANNINVDTYGTVVSALSREGSVEEAVLLLRAMVVEHSFTPVLSVFADVAQAAAKESISQEVLHVLTLAKAAGYELDSIASAEAGRSLLASGVIACEQMDNLALGLRLLTAAGKAKDCLPDRGDAQVAAHSSAAQRAATLIHKRAIDKAMEDDNWKLAVKILEVMPQRSLTPSNSVWRKVLTICAKCEKSRKATAILLDWVRSTSKTSFVSIFECVTSKTGFSYFLRFPLVFNCL
jgi:pentatricopeptide repeat protein